MTLANYPFCVVDLTATLQKGSSKKKGTTRGAGKKEEWHGLSLEEKNEIVSTEIEIYQAAIEKVSIANTFWLPIRVTFLFTSLSAY